jgi:3-hydroxybutyryl-CoA dehydrogenase
VSNCIEKIGIVGAGTMGSGIATVCSLFDQPVRIYDNNIDQIEKSKEEVQNNIRLGKILGKFKPKTENLFSLIDYVSDLEALSEQTLIIENIDEKMEKKKDLYNTLGHILSKNSVYVSNTSCVSIASMANCLPQPSQMVGVHFMNPAFLKKHVELIKTSFVSESTLERVQNFLSSIEKTWTVVNDMPGFVSNRVLMLTLNEAVWTIHDGIAGPKDVDEIFKKCFGHSMGPLETADLIGLDVVLDSLLVLEESFRDPKFRPCPLLIKMVNEHKYGKKSGQGFYPYFRK